MDKVYTIPQILAYASTFLKPGFCTDGKDSIEENQRLQIFMACIDLPCSSGIDKLLDSEKGIKLVNRYKDGV